jgi:hypothetical protein
VPEQQLCRENVKCQLPYAQIHTPPHTVVLSKLRRFLAQLGTFVVQMNACIPNRGTQFLFKKIFH